jgi:hypothetical protein
MSQETIHELIGTGAATQPVFSKPHGTKAVLLAIKSRYCLVRVQDQHPGLLPAETECRIPQAIRAALSSAI